MSSRLGLFIALSVSIPAQALAPPVAPEPLVVTVQLLAPPGTDLSGLHDLVAQSPGVPLSRSAVRRTIQLLDETGRFENVLAYSQPMSRGVALLIQLIPRLRLTGIGFHGNERFSDDELREKSGLRAGDEFVRDRVAAAATVVADFYRRAGFPSAQVSWDTTQSTTQAQVEFEVEEGQPLRVRRVEITGHPGLPLDQLRATFGIEAGQVVDQDALEQGVERLAQLYRKNHRYGAKAGPASIARVEGDQADIEVPVQSGPEYRLVLSGNRTFGDAQLRRVIDYSGQDAFDDSLLTTLADRLRDFYLDEGFLFAQVSGSVVPRPGGADILFAITEGHPYVTTSIDLRGVEELSRPEVLADLRKSVRVVPPDPFFSMPDSAEVDVVSPSGRPSVPTAGAYQPNPDIYVADVYAQAVSKLIERYHEEGFLAVHVAAPRLDIDLQRHEVAVQIDVREGPRTRIERIQFVGNEKLTDADLLPLTGLSQAQPLAKSALDRARKKLLASLEHRGLAFARVVAEQRIDESGTLAVLRFQVHEGPQVRVGRVLFRGNNRTGDAFLRRNLGLEAGELYDPDAFTHAQQKLQSLGIFDQVQIGLLEPEIAEPIKDLLVTLHERRPDSVVFSLGYSYIEGPRAAIEYDHLDLFGEAIDLQLRLGVNYFPASILALTNPAGNLELEGLPAAQVLQGKDNVFGFGGRASAVLADPRLFHLNQSSDASGRLELLGERIDRPYYAFTRAALLPGVTTTPVKRLTIGLQTDFEYNRIDTYGENLTEIFSVLSVADFQNLRFPAGQGFLGSIGPTIGYDGRDDPVNPRSGFAASLKGSWAAGLYYPEGNQAIDAIFVGNNGATTNAIDLFSVSGTLSGYVPLGPVVFALQVKGGRIFPVGNSFVIPTQRFFMGGPDSDRGFQQDTMLPQDYRTELHNEVGFCSKSATQASCSIGAAILRNGSQLPSPGGQVFEDIRGEARFPLYEKLLQGAIFVDAGNLWSDPGQYNLFELRPAAGVGVRLPTPVGSIAFDVGFNLDPDWTVNEQIAQPFLSISLF